MGGGEGPGFISSPKWGEAKGRETGAKSPDCHQGLMFHWHPYLLLASPSLPGTTHNEIRTMASIAGFCTCKPRGLPV